VSDSIAAAFAAASEQDRAALMPYLMGGFPDAAGSAAVAAAYADSGADLIELGVPFSDPLADGPVIHAAATAALASGATMASVLEICSAIADRVPVVLMVYSNMVLAAGAEEFAALAAAAGAAGAIVPDLPLDEADDVRGALAAAGLASIPLVAPTTPPERRNRICEAATGFVYVVSDVGTTGERSELPPDLAALVAEVRKRASVPAAVGFGIGTPEQAAQVGAMADGVIIGSRLVRLVADAADTDAAVAAVSSLLSQTRDALAGETDLGSTV
jgi:tryptophan synthase alpha chain